MKRPLLLLSAAFALGALAQALGMVPKLRDLPRPLAIGSEQLPSVASKPAPAPPAPLPELRVERIWEAGNYGYVLVRLSNQGDAVLAGSRGRVRCTAFDADDRALGSNSRSNRRPLRPREELEIEIPVALGAGTLESIQCGLES